ncbi:MAG: baseplate J/gp47 family protein [Microgenomates group bacterium]
MEISNFFKKIKSFEEKRPPETYLAVLIEDEFVNSAWWRISSEGIVEVVKVGKMVFFENDEEIITAIDQSLPPQENIASQKIIFGIPFSWLKESNEVKEEKMAILKTICREMNFEALGFVITPEAIAHHFKIKEGIPLSAILINFTSKKIFLSLIKVGKFIATEELVRSENLKEDLIEGFSRFDKSEVLPARIILYNQENLEEEKRQIEEISWEELEINFFHLPKVEILPFEFSLLSLVLAGGKEIGEVKGVILKEEAKIPTKEEISEESEVLEEEEKIEEISPSVKEEENFGFVKGEDITLKEEEIIPPTVVSTEESSQETEKMKPSLEKIKNLKEMAFPLFLKVGNIIKNSVEKILLLKGRKRSILLVLFLLLFLLGGGLFAYWWFIPKAKIILWVKPEILEKDLGVTVDPQIKSPDEEKLILPGEEIVLVLSKEGKKETTGVKVVGEPASGEVVIYNRTAKEKKFEKGTEIIGPDGLKFTLEEEVTVASESVGADYVKVPGKAKVKVKAVKIGAEGNLAAGTEFNINNYSKSDFVAKNEEAFSGGTSREIQVVAKKDKEELKKEILESLKEEIWEKFKEKISPDKEVIKDSLSYTIKKEIFDRETDEEAEEIKLNLEVEFKVLTYSNADFNKVLEKKISQLIPEGYQYKPEEKEVDFRLEKVNKDGTANFKVKFKAYLFPTFDLEAIKKDLRGKSLSAGQTYLNNLSKVNSYQIEITPQLPAKFLTFPQLVKNITVEVKRK